MLHLEKEKEEERDVFLAPPLLYLSLSPRDYYFFTPTLIITYFLALHPSRIGLNLYAFLYILYTYDDLFFDSQTE